MGNPATSPFATETLDAQTLEEGICTPKVITNSQYKFHKTSTVHNHEFVQVECGNSHTLLLNRAGQVFSFGNGLQAQLGTEKQLIHQPEPTQVFFS